MAAWRKLLKTEDFLRRSLEERLRREGYEIFVSSPGGKKGVDIGARKGLRKVFIEVKGEPFSQKSHAGMTQKFVADALLSLISRMKPHEEEVAYCLAFPDSYEKLIKRKLPAFVREKLGIHILFVQENNSLMALLPNRNSTIHVASLDDLFEK